MSFKDRLVAMLARPSLHPLLDRLIGYALRLKGFNNYPPEGGALGDSGEQWFIRNVLPKDTRTCLDVGGNRGDFAETLLTTTSATVICIEPNPAVAELAMRLNSRFGERFVLVTKAVSDRVGAATLSVDSAQTETATLSGEVTQHAYPGDRAVQVEVTTIDRLVEELNLKTVDFIKIDVEGFEIPCLDGAKSTLQKLRPKYVQVEMHWHHIFTGSTVFAMSQRLPGYKVYRLLPRGLAPVDPKTTLDNIFAYSNLIFVRQDT